jgi:signal transduction histidine kinase
MTPALSPSPAAPSGAPALALPEGDERVDILIVDDLPEKLLVFGTVLEELNQNLVFVRSGREALREVLNREFAVILLDVNMPEFDGFETAALIRQYKRSAHTPIIFITSYADELQTERGYSLGAVDYILSPVVPSVLRSKVQVFVHLFAMQEKLRRQADAQAAFVAAEAARRTAEDNDQRSAFLSQASHALNRSLDAGDAMHELARLLVPRAGPLSVVMTVDEQGRFVQAVASRAAPGRQADATSVVASAAPSASDVALLATPPSVPSASSAPEATPAPLPATPDEPVVERLAPDALPAPLRALLELAMSARSRVDVDEGTALALRNGDRLLGAMYVARHEGGAAGPVTPGWLDGHTLDDLAARAAAALDNARLHGSLREEIAERRAAEAELQEASRRKDEFLAMLSHELRNPLAPIRTALEVIRRAGPPEPRFRWASDVMTRQVQQMTRLIEELLDVARISQGKIVLTRERVDLGAVIAQSIEAVQPFIDAREQVLRVSLAAEPMWMLGDFARLSQVVSNLLNNASKYSEKHTTIDLVATQDAHGALVRIRDQGIGIDPELLPRIFDLFTQGERGLDRSQGGLGVGLTLARRLAEMHGGALTATSAGAHRGSEFQLRLPCLGVVRAGEPPAEPRPAARRAPAACRVLIVDDNPDAAQSIAALLALDGHHVETAGDGLQALDIAPSFAPDVVILDIGLPRLDGYEVARRMRAMAATAHSLLIALTGYGQREDRHTAAAAGFDRHFVKPADPARLLEAIGDWLEQRERGEAVPTAPASAAAPPGR